MGNWFQVSASLNISQTCVLGGKTVELFAEDAEYKGQLLRGKATGFGRCELKGGISYEGMWLNDEREGKGVITYPNGDREECEFKRSWYHGKMSCYYGRKILNETWNDGQDETSKDITRNPDYAFYHNGKPLKALATNWVDYK